MNRRTLPVAVAAAATVSLLLTACGGGDDKTNDKIAGSEQSAPPSASASPSASPSDVTGRPKITLPADFKNEFEGWTTGDPVKDAVLTDVTHRINATDAAIASDEPASPAIPFYYQRDALIGADKWIADYKKDGLTVTGTMRFFSPKIEVFSARSAAVTYCSDDTKAFNKDRKTGKVDMSASSSPYVTYSTALEKNDKGIWQTTRLDSKRGDKTCAP
ncbi:hypothetical protein J7F03_02705 [Streptomyces sp. ISL-43]|uniref:hypothetical protein n=1 Tax=Streptomyces sp. ISL-43 TaxID=2819183 RepID=UPI001BE8FBA2|nr:hypothetical protein [Streptomyces sp. ISL-43]MBT2446015.1 hypothetical protein [Streptomyces sp. ISL-43]